jgi:KRAB domain-containing zinc finger protein
LIGEKILTTSKMSYFPPHFMMPGRQDVPENLANGATAYAAAAKHVPQPWWLNYDQALDLQAQPQHKPMQMPVQIKHEHGDQARYGFDQVNCNGGQPTSVKQKTEKKYPCDQCGYHATQKSSLMRHKQTQHEGIRPQKPYDGKVHGCDLCPSTFSQLCSLNRHKMAKHSGIQYNCDQCEYVGTTALNTKLHKRSKHEGVRYPCDVCGYQATQSGVLNRHKVQKHGFQPSTEPRNQHNRAPR